MPDLDNITNFNPEEHADMAARKSYGGGWEEVFGKFVPSHSAIMAIKSRAQWVNINGRWVERKRCATYAKTREVQP